MTHGYNALRTMISTLGPRQDTVMRYDWRFDILARNDPAHARDNGPGGIMKNF